MSTTVSNQPLADYGVAADVIGELQYQYVKLVNSTTGSIVETGTASNPLPVKQTNTSLTADTPAAAVVGTSSSLVLAANTARKGVVLTNVSANRISISFGAAATINRGITIFASDRWEMNALSFNTEDIYAVASGASSTLCIQQFTDPTDSSVFLLDESGVELLDESGVALEVEVAEAPPGAGDRVLLEDGSLVLLETGDSILFEDGTPTAPAAASHGLMENGDNIIMENSDSFTLE